MIEIIFHPLHRPVWCREALLIETLDLHGIEYRITTPDSISENSTVITTCFLMETPCGDVGHDIAKEIIDRCSASNKLIFYYPSESYSTLSASFHPTASYLSSKSKSSHLICNGSWPIQGFAKVHYLTKFFAWALTNKFNLARLPYTINAIETFPKKKKFLYLNGEERMQRSALFNLIGNKGLLEKSLWSNRGGKGQTGHPPTVDWEDPFVHDDFRFFAYYPEHYYSTEFSVIAETAPEEFFLTEKTFKSLMLGHPFILQSYPRAIEQIQSMGFKTYGEVFDESYDKIKAIGLRNTAVANSVEKACNVSNIIEKTKEINDHNRRHFMWVANQVYGDLLNILKSIDDSIKPIDQLAVTDSTINKYFL